MIISSPVSQHRVSQRRLVNYDLNSLDLGQVIMVEPEINLNHFQNGVRFMFGILSLKNIMIVCALH